MKVILHQLQTITKLPFICEWGVAQAQSFARLTLEPALLIYRETHL